MAGKLEPVSREKGLCRWFVDEVELAVRVLTLLDVVVIFAAAPMASCGSVRLAVLFARGNGYIFEWTHRLLPLLLNFFVDERDLRANGMYT